MSFTQQSWGRISGSANNDVVTLQNGSYIGAPNLFTYISATDTLADIAASNYFLAVFNELNVNDLIYVAGTDGVDFLTVLTVSNASVTVAVNTAGGDVTGPASSTNNNFVLFNGTTGKIIKDSTFSIVPGSAGGTGVANIGKTITIGGDVTTDEAVTFSGAFTFTGTITANTAVTFPTSGTLATTDGTIASANILSGVTAVYGGGGTSNAFTVTGLTTAFMAVCTIQTATNNVSVTTVVCTADTLTVGFSADPGAGTTVNYWAYK